MKKINTSYQYDYKNEAEFERHRLKIEKANDSKDSAHRWILVDSYRIGGTTDEDEYTYTAIWTFGTCI